MVPSAKSSAVPPGTAIICPSPGVTAIPLILVTTKVSPSGSKSLFNTSIITGVLIGVEVKSSSAIGSILLQFTGAVPTLGLLKVQVF